MLAYAVAILLAVSGDAAPLADPTALEAQDPDGHRRVMQLVELVTKVGCQGPFRGLIRELVDWDFMSCGSMDDPPQSIIAFWLGDKRYLIEIHTKRD